jgi:hypothetical protein
VNVVVFTSEPVKESTVQNELTSMTASDPR